MTQDNLFGNPIDPLSQNLYAYCKNNPVAYVDPSGHFNVCIDGPTEYNGIDTLYYKSRFVQSCVDSVTDNVTVAIQLVLMDLPTRVALSQQLMNSGYQYVANSEIRQQVNTTLGDWAISAYEQTINGDMYYAGYLTAEVATAVIGTKGVSKISSAAKSVKLESVATEGVTKVKGIGFNSFKAIKNYLGSPGKGKEWHHIVEQSQIRRSGFTSQMINNTENVIAIDSDTHRKISGFYSSKTAFSEGKTVRDWLAGQSFDKQYEFGMKVLRDFGVIE